MQRTETDHLEMMKHPERWPNCFILPLQHVARKEPRMSGMKLLGFLFADIANQAKPRVYVGSIYFHYEGTKLEDLPVEDYPDLEAVVAAGWRVN